MNKIAALMGSSFYALYALLGRDSKKVELEDELSNLRNDEAGRGHWALLREAVESFIGDETYAKLSAVEQSAMLYRYIERRYEGRIKGSSARVKMLEEQIRKSDEARVARERARTEAVDDAAARERILKIKLEDAGKEIESLKKLLDARAANEAQLQEALRQTKSKMETWEAIAGRAERVRPARSGAKGGESVRRSKVGAKP